MFFVDWPEYKITTAVDTYPRTIGPVSKLFVIIFQAKIHAGIFNGSKMKKVGNVGG